MLLESGPAATDRNYNLVFAIAFLLYAGWCFYDWQFRYIEHNREEARKALVPLIGEQKMPRELGRSLTDLSPRELIAKSPVTRDEVVRHLGEPIHTARDAAGDVQTDWFVSDYGRLSVQYVPGGRFDPTKVEWATWKHEKHDIALQGWMLLATLALVSVFAYRVIRAMLVRVTIDESEMRYANLRVPVANMKRLVDYSRKGWVDLYYSAGAGPERKLRIDNQKVGKFDEIIDTLCKLKGFPDPRKTDDQAAPAEQA